jgi:hypothetical protein
MQLGALAVLWDSVLSVELNRTKEVGCWVRGKRARLPLSSPLAILMSQP